MSSVSLEASLVHVATKLNEYPSLEQAIYALGHPAEETGYLLATFKELPQPHEDPTPIARWRGLLSAENWA